LPPWSPHLKLLHESTCPPIWCFRSQPSSATKTVFIPLSEIIIYVTYSRSLSIIQLHHLLLLPWPFLLLLLKVLMLLGHLFLLMMKLFLLMLQFDKFIPLVFNFLVFSLNFLQFSISDFLLLQNVLLS
jgi:hypothetical protein